MARRSPTQVGDCTWWGFSGPDGENVTTFQGPDGPLIETMLDLSGNGNTCTSNNSFAPAPTYRDGAFDPNSSWKTTNVLLAAHRYGDENSNGAQTYGAYMEFDTPLEWTGAFTMFFLVSDIRDNGGQYDLLGSSSDFVVHESTNSDRGRLGALYLGINSSGLGTKVAQNLPAGQGIIRLERDASDRITVWHNRTNVTVPGLPAMPGTFTAPAWGFCNRVDASQAQWDNNLLEMAFFDRVLTAQEIVDLEHFWNVPDRWGGLFRRRPSTQANGSRRISPFTDIVHSWERKGSDPESVAGRMELWESPSNSWRAWSNADRLATWNVPDIGEPVRPLHTVRMDEHDPAWPGPGPRDPYGPFFNSYAWDFYKQFYFPSDSQTEVIIPHTGSLDHWIDIKRSTSPGGPGHREFTWPMLDCFMRGNVTQRRTAWAALREQARTFLERRPFSHLNEPVPGRYMPFKGYADDVNPDDEKIDPSSNKFCDPVTHRCRRYDWSQLWNESGEHVSDPRWEGSWSGTKFSQDDRTKDERTLEHYSFEGWNMSDRGHHPSHRWLAAAIAGAPEGYVDLWMLWRLTASGFPSFDPNVHFCSQPRSCFWAIELGINAHLAGFDDADPALLKEQTAYWNNSFPNGVKPLPWLQMALRFILTARWTGGAGNGGAGMHLDSSNENRGDNNHMQLLCNAAKTNFNPGTDCNKSETGPDCWWTFNGERHFRNPAYGRYVWQCSWLLLGMARARRFYEWYEQENGERPFDQSIYIGLGEALDYYHDYFGDRAVIRGGSTHGDPDGTVAYSVTVDKYHTAADAEAAGNPYPHRSYLPVTDPGQPREVWDALRSSFLDICGNLLWSNADFDGKSTVRFSQHPSNGKWYAWRSDNAKTGCFSYVPSRAMYKGTTDSLVQLAFNGPDWRPREAGDQWFNTWAQFADLYYALAEWEARGSDDGGGQSKSFAVSAFGFVSRFSVIHNRIGISPGSPTVHRITISTFGGTGEILLRTSPIQQIMNHRGYAYAEFTTTHVERHVKVCNVGGTASVTFTQSPIEQTLSTDGIASITFTAIRRDGGGFNHRYQAEAQGSAAIAVVHQLGQVITTTGVAQIGFQTQHNEIHTKFLDVRGCGEPAVKQTPGIVFAAEGWGQFPGNVYEIVPLPTNETSIPAPVIETVGKFVNGTLRLRIYRVPTSLMGTGGYQIYRSDSRTGFGGRLGTDFELLATSVPQLDASAIFEDVELAGQSTTESQFYRVRAVDDLTSPTIESPWSNVAAFWKLPDRTVPVPTMPSNLRPGRGVLGGIVDSLQDSDDVSGDLTWYEFIRRCVRVAQDQVFERLLDRFPEVDAYSLYLDPPGDLVDWYEHLVVLSLLPITTLPVSEIEEKGALHLAAARKAEGGLFSSEVVHPGGSPAKRIYGGRRVR